MEGLCTLCLTAVTLVGFRVYLMGNKPPEFAPADNPASDADSVLTRVLTFNYLPFVNLWLLFCPYLLSFDWSMDAVPLVERVTDIRNLCTLSMYLTVCYAVWHIINNLHVVDGCTKQFYSNGHVTRKTSKASRGNGVCNNMFSSSHPTSPFMVGSTRRRIRRSSCSSTESDEFCSTHGGEDAIMKKRHDTHIILLSLAFLIVPFVPATNLFFYVGFVVAERVLYIPSMGFCLLVGHGVEMIYTRCRRKPWRKHVLVLWVIGLLAAYSVRTMIRNRDWVSEEQLYKSGITVNPAKGEEKIRDDRCNGEKNWNLSGVIFLYTKYVVLFN